MRIVDVLFSEIINYFYISLLCLKTAIQGNQAQKMSTRVTGKIDEYRL